jgi:hypothetical protein
VGIDSCQFGTEKETDTIKPSKQRCLKVEVRDFSISTKDISYFVDTSEARQSYYTIANNGGGIIKIIGVYANSLKSDVQTIAVKSLDTLSLTNNVYLKRKNLLKNKDIRKQFYEQSEKQIARYIALISGPRNEPYSDLLNACALAKVTLEQPNYEGYQKYLVFYSDMDLDLPHTKNDELLPIQLTNTTVVFLRPLLSKERLKNLFPGSPVILATSSEDINSIIQTN